MRPANTLIQYASDLHLDHFLNGTPVDFTQFLMPSAPILVLAGDVASAWNPIYHACLIWCSYMWDRVILVAGNHEYHCDPSCPKTRPDTDRHIQRLCSMHRNVHYLQNGAAFYLPGTKLVFLGTTLYSAIDPAIYDQIRKKSDYCHSYTNQLVLATPAYFTRLHRQQVQSLSNAIRAVPRGYKAIVVSHYMPTEQLLEPEYRQEEWRSCYASPTDALIRPPVCLWICGHSHRQVLYTTPKGIQMAMNARGYNKPHELERTQDVYSPYMRVQINATK
jgi:Calcineurin-like phosphoesterase